MIETLEHRLLRSGVIKLDGRTVIVSGTSGDDVIIAYGKPSRIVVALNNKAQTFLGKDVRRVIVYGGAGNDRVDAGAGDTIGGRQLRIPARIDGGTGNDLIYSGEKGDTLLGGNGNDRLIGSINHDAGDYHDGGIGDDEMMFGGVMYGGRGNDTATGDNLYDPIVGGIEQLYTVSDGRGSWENPAGITPAEYCGDLSTRRGRLAFRFPTSSGYEISLSSPTVRADGMLQIVLKARFKSEDFVQPMSEVTTTLDRDDAIRRGIVLKYDDPNGAFGSGEGVVLLPSA